MRGKSLSSIASVVDEIVCFRYVDEEDVRESLEKGIDDISVSVHFGVAQGRVLSINIAAYNEGS